MNYEKIDKAVEAVADKVCEMASDNLIEADVVNALARLITARASAVERTTAEEASLKALAEMVERQITQNMSRQHRPIWQ